MVRGGLIAQAEAPTPVVATYGAPHPAPVAHVSYSTPALKIAYSSHAGHVSYPSYPNSHLAYQSYPSSHHQVSYPTSHIAYPTQHLAYSAHSAPVAIAAPVTKVVTPVAKAVVDTEYDPHPQYSYAYNVEDSVTGDSKNHHETRDGDVVKGSYSLNDSDGTRRTVDYTADPVHGFNAVVRKEPLAHSVPVVTKVATAPVVTKLAHAPFVAKYAQAPAPVPVTYHHNGPAPVAYVAAHQRVAYAPVPYEAHVEYSSPYYHYKH